MQPNLAGIYITDRFIDVILGYDDRRGAAYKIGSDLRVKYDNKNWIFSVQFDSNISAEKTIYHLIRTIKTQTKRLHSVTVGCYGPFASVDPNDRGKRNYGLILPPTHGLRLKSALNGRNIHTIVTNAFKREFDDLPLISVELDVITSAIGEFYRRFTNDGVWDVSSSKKTLAFIKISNGIGCGIVQGIRQIVGIYPNSIGSILVRDWEDGVLDPDNKESQFGLHLPFSRTLEALASLSAFEKRWAPYSYIDLEGQPDHEAWHRQAWYIAQACYSVTRILSPSDIVLGGRVMGVKGLVGKVREQFRAMAGTPPFPRYPAMRRPGYISATKDWKPGRPGRSGALGALCLAAVNSRPQGSVLRMGHASGQ